MKKIKAMACVLAVAMLAGIFAGCSKTTKLTTDKFAKACEKLKLENFDLYDGAPDEDDYEDGVYAVMDSDDIEDEPGMVEGFLSPFGIDDIIDSDDVLSMGVAFKCKGMDDLNDIKGPDDLEDAKVDAAFAVLIELDNNYVEDFMDYLEDSLDTFYVDTKSFTSKEFYVSKNDGYIRLHIEASKLAKILQDNDDIMEFIDEVYDEDDFNDLCKSITGDIAITIEINGNNIFILGGLSINNKPTVLNSFASAFGSTNPTKIPMNTKLVEKFIEDIYDDYGEYLGYMTGSTSSLYDIDDYDLDYDLDDYDLDDYDLDDGDI
ncbi:MAG: hypothetical protein IKG01_09440 [Lachnospiraceae bacterium]|nr:hypothetical protein [Lachnospiraceae bacterium]